MTALHRLPAAVLVSAAVTLGTAWIAHSVAPVEAAEAAGKAPTHDGLVIEIQGIEHDKGKILVMIYDDEGAWERYDDQQMAAYYEFDAVETGVRLDFDTLTAGPYAIALWHDENGDGELDMAQGYPMEGYGTSGARDAYDEVPWSRAAIEPGLVTVRMYYPEW